MSIQGADVSFPVEDPPAPTPRPRWWSFTVPRWVSFVCFVAMIAFAAVTADRSFAKPASATFPFLPRRSVPTAEDVRSAQAQVYRLGATQAEQEKALQTVWMDMDFRRVDFFRMVARDFPPLAPTIQRWLDSLPGAFRNSIKTKTK